MNPADDDKTQVRVGGYDLLFELAAGGMAQVMLGRATHKSENEPFVAVKCPHAHLATDKGFVAMLFDEARLASAIDHPNVVRVRELGFAGEVPFIVLDYVEGCTLADLRKELSAHERALDASVAARIAIDALRGLHAAHELADPLGKPMGIIHRDVSPQNVLIGVDGVARITDFGVAKAEDRAQVTRTHEVKGKLAYLAPERIDRRRLCTVQSDVFSMAIVLWEMLAARRLFRGETALDTLEEVMRAPIPSLRQLGARIPEPLDRAVARALSRDLEVRHKTAGAFADEIQSAIGEGALASPEQVGLVVEAVFGWQLAARHARVRAALGDAQSASIFACGGLALRTRAEPQASADSLGALGGLLSAAPSVQYALGPLEAAPLTPGLTASRAQRIAALRVPAFAVASALCVAALTLAVAIFPDALRTTPAPAPPSSPASRSSPSSGTAAPALGPPQTRRVTIELPFIASGAQLDGVDHPIDPPAATFEATLTHGAPSRHSVRVTGLDGARAEAVIVEQDGVGRVLDGTLILSELPAASPAAATATATATTTASATAPASASTTASTSTTTEASSRPRAPSTPPSRSGFTKLP